MANFDENCTIYSKQVLVNEINWIINSDKFRRSYEYLYLGVTFWGTHVYNQRTAPLRFKSPRPMAAVSTVKRNKITSIGETS